MIYKPLQVTDKSGCTVTLRNAQIEDAQNMIDYLKVTASETPYLLRSPDEISLSLAQEQAFLQNMMDSHRELMLLAFLDGKHVGACSMTQISGYRRHAHRCDIAIALYQQYCGRGIGAIMLKAILAEAKKAGYEQAELEVVADNHSAIALYEKLGFVRLGTFPDQMKYETGKYVDAYWMMKKL